MFTFVAVLGLGFGGMVLGVVLAGVRRGYFPFRPRRGEYTPPPGCRHSGPARVSRLDEPDLFWGMAILLAAGAGAVAMGVAMATKLF